ncbi:MFS transporter [Catenulispora subtropica]|uniref:MFS transporter n=1 Tax=Catenulispora subtropica TaxID=450798 RepID=A0ABN2TCA4_9ACTN
MSGSRPAGTPDEAAVGILDTLRGVPTVVRVLLVGVFVNRLGAFLQAFMVLYLVHRGFSATQAGVALTLYGAGSVLGLFGGGGLADRFGPRLTIAGSNLAGSALVASVSLVSVYPVILAVVFVTGAISVSYRPATASILVANTPKARQTMVMAFNRTAANVGSTVGPLLAVWLISVSWNLIFWIDGATSFVYGVIALLVLPADAARGDRPAAARPKTGYRMALRDRRFGYFLAMVFVNAVIYVQMTAVLPLSVKQAGHATIVYSSLFSLNAGLVIAFELLITRFVQHWAPRRTVMTGFVLLGAGMVGFGLPGGVPTLLAAMLLVTLGEMVGGPSVFSWPARVAPEGATGRYLGTMQSVFGLGQAVGPAIGVALWNSAHQQVWWWVGAAAAAGITIGWLGMRDPAAEPDAESQGAAEGSAAPGTEAVPA